MAMAHFDFGLQQFGIKQRRSAMKVGTDAIALGAWVADLSPDAEHILDIGAGTGILALMMAQHYPDAQITALEIDEGAYCDMQENFEASPWHHRLMACQTDALLFTAREPYDLIISNPPFFSSHSLRAEGATRQLARNEEVNGLGIVSLIHKAKTLLSTDGVLALVCPVDREENLRRGACEALMYIAELCVFHSSPDVPVRLLSLLRPLQGANGYKRTNKSKLIQRELSGEYTAQYKGLIRDYLLVTKD